MPDDDDDDDLVGMLANPQAVWRSQSLTFLTPDLYANICYFFFIMVAVFFDAISFIFSLLSYLLSVEKFNVCQTPATLVST